MQMNKKLVIVGKFFAIIICIPIVGLVIFMSPWLWKIPIHNMRLLLFERSFNAIEHIEGSRKIASHKEFGNFGNSNHCDYFVGEFRVSDLPREVIASHYQNLHIPPPDDSLDVWSGSPPKETDIEVYFLDEAVFQHWPWSDWLIKYSKRLADNLENTYLVFAMEDGYTPSGDFRCH